MRSSATLGVAAATVLSAAVGAAPAAAGDDVGLSIDGHHWSNDVTRPLLDPSLHWVPGDRRSASFYVRDQGPTGAHLTIGVETRDPDRLLADQDIALSARAAHGAWRPLENGQDAGSLLDGPMARSATVRVDVRVRFRWSSDNASRVDRLPLDFVVRLTQAGRDGGPGPHPQGGFLPGTGSAVESWLVLVGVALVGSGASLLVVRVRRERAHG
ncbi:LPXTG cell wall anchor domain-containing protein [Nocardioides panacisoli]|uniref:LPXTG cell wall anchor domain-containing protein n=1 Tax=Nocardioides panacisoli TaxID=627624 RepID=A0ABP7J0M1_9ACTN